jgi:DNA-binding winged helix-turn-helix (wHTH) protein
MKFRFGPFELDSRARTLRRGDVMLPLSSRALDILVYLANRPGEVIKKKELIDHVWSDVFVEEVALRVHVSFIRKALGDGQFGNRYIANIYGRGYSFVGAVVRLEDSQVSREASVARFPCARAGLFRRDQ